jgi:hypothetical protein
MAGSDTVDPGSGMGGIGSEGLFIARATACATMRKLLLIACIGLLAGCQPAPTGVDLSIPINARCTTCNDYVRCDGAAGSAAIYDPTFDLYHLQPKDLLAQIATIWDYLVQMLRAKSEDRRPLTIYSQRPGRDRAFDREVTRDSEARIDLVTHRIEVPGAWVDQQTGAWHHDNDQVAGQCRLLSRDEGRQLAELFAEPAPAR